MRAHYLQHIPFEGLGSIERWLQDKGYEITSTQLHKSEKLPNLEEIDLLIVMGGPMSVSDESHHPWLVDEKAFIKEAIQTEKSVLGICLGAQLIAHVMGAKILPNPVKEIGWFPITAITPQQKTAFLFPKETEVFHWHGETFSLPNQATLLAESKACKNQAFQIGQNVIGLQFHLETTPASAQAIVQNCREELIEAEYIQSEKEILSVPNEKYAIINELMERVLGHLHTRNV